MGCNIIIRNDWKGTALKDIFGSCNVGCKFFTIIHYTFAIEVREYLLVYWCNEN